MIRFEGFSFWYGEADKPALKDINLRIDEGEFILVSGPSGGGKSSLCRCLNGLIPHFYGGRVKGRVEVQGLEVMKYSTGEMATRVGLVFQDPENQLVTMDVEREIAFGMENLAFPRELILRRLEESLDLVGISALRDRPLHELSGGEKQKVALASVLALHPDILVLDEPTSELDPQSAEEILTIVGRLNDELGMTVILIEHRLDRVIQWVDRLIILAQGEVVADGAPRLVLGGGKIAEFGLGLPPIIRLAQGLRNKGLGAEETPLSVKEGRMMLGSVFQRDCRPLPRAKVGEGGRVLVEVEKLWHTYSNGTTALKGISLKLCEGDFVAVMGRNGSGKTTLVKHFNGLLKPARGSVSVEGIDTKEATIAELAQRVGLVFQNPNDHLFADTVEEEIGCTLKNLHFGEVEIASRVNELLEGFNLQEYRGQYPRSLSGGEKQRVALASVLVARPRILILDEPTRGMEYWLKSELMNFLSQYRIRGNAVVLVTHDVETVAEHADRVILLGGGRVIAEGSKREVLSGAFSFSPQINRLVQAFEGYGIPGNILTADELLRMVG